MHAKAYRTRCCHLTFLQVAHISPLLHVLVSWSLPLPVGAQYLLQAKVCCRLLRPLGHVDAAAALQREMQARVCLFANLLIRPDIRICLSCLDVTRRWRLQCWIRRAAALLLKAAAAAASGELLPCRACAFLAACRRKPPYSFFQMIAGSLIVLPPAAGLLRLLDAGAGKPHARVRSSSHVRINAPFRIGDGMHVHVLARRWLLQAFAACCRAASRGNLVWRACKQVHLLVVGCAACWCCRAAAACLLLHLHHHCVHHQHVCIIIVIINS
jgi:hypothetical protein